MLKIVSLLVFIFGQNFWANAQVEGGGEMAIETRAFEDDDDSTTVDQGLAIFARVHARLEKENFLLAARGFSRVDRKDKDRQILAVEELYAKVRLGDYDLIGGYQVFNWSATEAFHPVDIINSRNYDSPLENLEKLGEFNFSFVMPLWEGDLSFYYFPLYKKPIYPGVASRLGLNQSLGDPVWVEKNGFTEDSYGPQGGFRLNQTFGNVDLSLHYIYHLDRHQPLFILDTNNEIRPYYYAVNQYGGSYTHVLGEYILKAEYAYRDFVSQTAFQPVVVLTPFGPVVTALETEQVDHTQVAIGVEKGISFDFGHEGTVVAEAMGVFGVDKADRAQLHTFQRDMILAYRHAFNDAYGKEIFFSFIFDLERSHEYLYNAHYTQRLSDAWKIKLGFRVVDAPRKEDAAIGLEHLDGANQIFFNLTRFF